MLVEAEILNLFSIGFYLGKNKKAREGDLISISLQSTGENGVVEQNLFELMIKYSPACICIKPGVCLYRYNLVNVLSLIQFYV